MSAGKVHVTCSELHVSRRCEIAKGDTVEGLLQKERYRGGTLGEAFGKHFPDRAFVEVNGRMVGIKHPLKEGDEVELVISRGVDLPGESAKKRKGVRHSDFAK